MGQLVALRSLALSVCVLNSAWIKFITVETFSLVVIMMTKATKKYLNLFTPKVDDGVLEDGPNFSLWRQRSKMWPLIQMKPLQQYFHMALFIQYVVLVFESVDEILWCYQSNETSSAVLSHGTIYLVCGSNFWVCGWNPMLWPFRWNLFSSTFTWHYLVCSSNF